MPKLRVYLETTMFNFFFDETRESHIATVAFFDAIREGRFEAYTSRYVVDELRDAQEPKRSAMLRLIETYDIVVIEPGNEELALAEVYLRAEEGIPKKKYVDARHIAVASVNHLDIILSCNFHHINKLKTKEMVRRINPQQGYAPVIICRPEEVVDYDN